MDKPADQMDNFELVIQIDKHEREIKVYHEKNTYETFNKNGEVALVGITIFDKESR